MISFSQPRPRVPAPPVIHLQHCDCAECAAPARLAPRRLSAGGITRWGIAGIVTGNLIGFAIDSHGALHALAGAVAQLLGIAR